jgi:predicted permease
VILGSVQPLLIALTAAVALLLLIACVNVGNLLVLRAAERSRELAVRRALGATFGDLMRQLLVESSALGILGGALGLVCARGLLHLLVVFAPAQLPRADVIRLAGAPTATTLGVTLLSVLIFGVAPAFLAAGASASSSLRLGTRSGSVTRTRTQFKQMMVAAQVALTLVLLVGAALLGRTLERLERLNLGYDAGHLAMLELSEPASMVRTVPAVLAATDEVVAHLRAVPGIVAVTPVIVPPFISASVWRWKFDAEGQTEEQVADDPTVPIEMGGPDYFRTFAIPITSGRGFTESDRADAPLVVVVSQSVAHRLWPGESAIGKRVRVPATPTNTSGWEHGGQWRTVIGVAGDIRYRSLRDAAPTVYLPWRQGIAQGFFAVRSSADLASILPPARRALREINPDLGLWRARTMDDLLAGPLAQPRLATVVMTGFGVASLLLAAIGLYGVMASTVRERTRDIGVRIALGATPSRVRGEVVRQMLGTFGLGALTGLAAAFALSRLLTKLLFEVSPADPLAFATAGAVLLIVSLGAAFVPARRATGIDPAQALRAE